MPTVHLIIHGKVQGVFYRASAREKAEALGITGWVKNTDEGAVEMIATGSQHQLDEFISWCRKGPSKAVVTKIAVHDLQEQSFNRFSIERTSG
jgi:acylphosphatase